MTNTNKGQDLLSSRISAFGGMFYVFFICGMTPLMAVLLAVFVTSYLSSVA